MVRHQIEAGFTQMKHYSRTSAGTLVSNSQNNSGNPFAILFRAGFGFLPLLALLKRGRKSAAFRKTSGRLGLILTAANCTTAAFSFRTAASSGPDYFIDDPRWPR
jgi:hypothetical protein